MIEAGSMYLDEGSGRTWEVVGPTQRDYVLCLGEPEIVTASGASIDLDPEVRVFAPVDLTSMTYTGRASTRFARYRREGFIDVCIHCGKVREGTAAYTIAHQRECILAAAYARGMTALHAEQTDAR